MRWNIVFFCALIGFARGGFLGGVAGAALGYFIQLTILGAGKRRPVVGNAPGVTFCACAAALLAKMAKADGVVSPSEINSVELAFRRLGFSPEVRRYAVNVFRKAKDDSRSIYEYAREFAYTTPSVGVREFLYELLWDLACSDGVVGAAELDILRNLPSALRISPHLFTLFCNERLRRSAPPERERRDELADAYRLLGVTPSADDAAVKSAYRAMAKKYHPDTLRAQGLPEEMVGKATAMMSKVNAAWTLIKASRGL